MLQTLNRFSDWVAAPPFARKLALSSCLDRIRQLDPELRAWVRVSPVPPLGKGPLFGIPLGVKDVFDTDGLATEYGSDLYAGRVGSGDAAIVRELRERGAIVIGKTHTAAFAYRQPAPTRNPLNGAHTPGGSSSGSAAAVAAGMIPLALGTQTKGSVLRPASYCGVTGFKPTFGLIPVDGLLPFSPSLDTVGFFTSSPGDMLAFWQAFTGPTVRGCEGARVGALSPLPSSVEPAMAAAFDDAVERMLAGGIDVERIDLTGFLTDVAEAADVVMFVEAANAHGERYDRFGDRLADVADAVRKGRAIARRDYEDALARLREQRAAIATRFEATPIIASPAATGPAPLGLASTGDAAMNAPWTALGTPAISVPMPVSSGLPLGLQLTAARGTDAALLRAACDIHDILHR